MNRVLIFFIFICLICISQIPVSAQMRGFGGRGVKMNRALQGKKIVNKLILYNSCKYDSKKSGEEIAREKLKREIIDALRYDIMSSYSSECPVQSSIDPQDYSTLTSVLIKNGKGSSDWDDGVLEYQAAVAVSTSDFAKILCVISNDKNLLDTINKNQKRADDALAAISQLQNDSYVKGKQDEYDRAVNIFKATNYFKEGIFSGVLKDSEGALKAYEEALKFFPAFPEAYYQRAEIYRGMSKNHDAVSDYSRAINYDPDNAEYYTARGICYFTMKEQDRAMKDFNHVISLKPSDPISYSAYAARGNIYEIKGQDQKALNDYTRAIDLDPKAVDIYFRMGLLNRRLKKYEESVKNFDQAIKIDKKYSDAYFERGTTYAYLGDKEKVLNDYKEAARLGCTKAREFLDSKNIKWE